MYGRLPRHVFCSFIAVWRSLPQQFGGTKGYGKFPVRAWWSDPQSVGCCRQRRAGTVDGARWHLGRVAGSQQRGQPYRDALGFPEKSVVESSVVSSGQ